MYDSRYNHSRNGLHVKRADRKRYNGKVGDYTLITRPVLEAHEAIAEGLTDLLPDWEYLLTASDEEYRAFGYVPPYQGVRSQNLVVPETWTSERNNTNTSGRNRRPAKATRRPQMNTYPSRPSAGSVPLVGTDAKRRASKQPFSRLKAEEFDPSKVSRTLSGNSPYVRQRVLVEAAETLTLVLMGAIDADQPARVVEYGVKDRLPEGDWREHAMSDCVFGCKIYRNEATHERVVAHNSAYGCYIAGTPA